jgi:hypothetical protein
MPSLTVKDSLNNEITIQTLPGLGQTNKAGSLPVALASDDDLHTKIGEVQATPTANTVLGRLKALLTGISLAPSEAHAGQVGGHIAIASAAMTRPADTSAYSVGDLIANNTVAGSVVPIALAVARVNDGSGMIRRIRLKTNDAAFAAAVIRVHLYRDSPTVTNGDNGTFLTTESNYIGYADITLDRHFSDAEKGFGVPAVGPEWSFQSSAGTQNIYALLEARSAVTPGSAKTWTLIAETFQN